MAAGFLKNVIEKWAKDSWHSFESNFPESLVALVFLPLLVWAMVQSILGFSFLATLGYLVFCIKNLGKILEDFRKPLVWGIAYILGAVIFDVFIKNVPGLFSKGDGASIFSGLVILWVLIILFVKKEEMKK